MNFIDQLIFDVKSGMWDYVWTWNNEKYTFIPVKHYLRGLNFTLEYGGKKGSLSDVQNLIFPNGFSVQYPLDKILELKESVDESLERTVIDSQKTYLNPPVVVDEDESKNIKPKEDINDDKI